MSLRSKITAAVNKAFTAVGDIAETVTLRTKVSGDYDFLTGTTNDTYEESLVAAIVISVKQKPDDTEILAPRKEVYIKESDLENPALYDTVVINSVPNTIINFTKEPGLITLLVTEG
jgi:hypothetical protein